MADYNEEELKLQRELNPTIYVGAPDDEDAKLMAEIDAAKAAQKPKQESVALPRQKAIEAKVEELAPIAEATTAAVIQDVDQKTANDNPGSLRSKLGESLKFFAPDLVGAAIGGIFGGVEGAAGGIEAGGKIRKDLTDFELAKLNLEQNNQRLNRFQKSEEVVDSRTQEPLNYDPITGTYKNQKGEIVPADKQTNLKAIRENRLLDQGGDRIDIAKKNTALREEGLGVTKDRFEFTKEEKNELSDKQLETVTGFDNALDSLNRVEKLAPGVFTGPIDARVQKLAEYAGAAPENFTKLKSELTTLITNFLKSQSGLVVTDSERKMLMEATPTPNDTEKTFLAKAEQFRKGVESSRNRTMSNLKKYQGKATNINTEFNSNENAPIKIMVDKKTGKKYRVQGGKNLGEVQ